MGTHGTISILGDSSDKNIVASCMKATFDELLRIENLLSHYNQNSEVSILNKVGCIKNPSRDLLYVLEKANYFYNLSGGLFDVTILPLLELLSSNSSQEFLNEKIKEVQELVDFNGIEYNEYAVSFRKKGMKITLGGIAKGYAIDRAMDVLKKMGVKDALIDIGGDIKAMSDSHSWIIGIRNPFKKDDIISKVNIRNQAIATSGNYERLHVFSPWNLRPLDVASATIIAREAIDADALATIALLIGPDVVELVSELSGVEALLIMKDGKMIRSSGFRDYEV
jgi:thiamine biosynthesis lipoprotein